MTRQILSFVFAFILVFGISQWANAQDMPPMQPQAPQADIEVSDTELRTFIHVSNDVQALQQSMQQNMISKIEENDMEVDRFVEIDSAMQQGQSTEELNVSDSEMSVFQELSAFWAELQEDTDDEIMETIDNSGMDLDRIQEIFAAIQTNPELQAKYMAIMEEIQAEQGSEG